MANPNGRRGGIKGKAGVSAKENIMAVFTRLGGTAAMAEWAKNNQTEFYKLYGRLVPVEGPGQGGAHKFEITASWLQDAAKSRGW